jgi:hypothetical protein
MPRLKNRLHERFAWLVAEGLDRTAAYRKLCPHATAATQIGYQVYCRPEVKDRIAEIQAEVHSRAVMAIDQKRDILRQMVEGVLPTKVVKKADGKVEATFDRLAALTVDAKLAGEFAEDQRRPEGSDIKLSFEVYHRNAIAPKAWLEAELVVPEPVDVPGDSVPALDYSNLDNADLNQPGLDDVVRTAQTDML